MRDKYPPSEPCSCEICRSYCVRPGWWTVEEASKAIKAGYGHRMMLEIAPEMTFGVLSPAFKGCEGFYALQEYSKNGCNFYTDGLCELFGTGLSPLECRYCHHLRKGLGQKCHEDIEKDWRTPVGQTFTAIVKQGVPAGGKIRKYLEDSGENLGFNVTKGCCVWTLNPMTEGQKKDLQKKVKKCSERYYKSLMRSTPPVPSVFRLMLFRMGRRGVQNVDKKYYDYEYYKNKGWFESDYYYETSLGPFKKLLGRLFDFMGKQVSKRM